LKEFLNSNECADFGIELITQSCSWILAYGMCFGGHEC